MPTKPASRGAVTLVIAHRSWQRALPALTRAIAPSRVLADLSPPQLPHHLSPRLQPARRGSRNGRRASGPDPIPDRRGEPHAAAAAPRAQT